MPRESATQRAHAQTLREIVQVLQPALNRFPSVEPVHKAQRAVGVLSRALDELLENLR
jgi:hypothetical protein